MNDFQAEQNLVKWDELSKKLIEYPFALMGDKLNIVIEHCKEYNIKNLLEVGTFCGGSAYVLGKNLPNTKITSIDTNTFEEFFSHSENDNVKECFPSYFENLTWQYLPKIQKFYGSQLDNVSLLTNTLRNIDISKFDAIILDGDHHQLGLQEDLNYVIKNRKTRLIYVDDCSHFHIWRTVRAVTARHRKLKLIYTYNGDLAVIRRTKKKK